MANYLPCSLLPQRRQCVGVLADKDSCYLLLLLLFLTTRTGVPTVLSLLLFLLILLILLLIFLNLLLIFLLLLLLHQVLLNLHSASDTLFMPRPAHAPRHLYTPIIFPRNSQYLYHIAHPTPPINRPCRCRNSPHHAHLVSVSHLILHTPFPYLSPSIPRPCLSLLVLPISLFSLLSPSSPKNSCSLIVLLVFLFTF